MTEEEAIEARILQNEKEENFPVLETEKDGYKRFSQWLYEVVKDAHQDELNNTGHLPKSEP